jgi:hypothetical protein
LHDDAFEPAALCPRSVIVERVPVARQFREQLDIASADEACALGAVTDPESRHDVPPTW